VFFGGCWFFGRVGGSWFFFRSVWGGFWVSRGFVCWYGFGSYWKGVRFFRGVFFVVVFSACFSCFGVGFLGVSVVWGVG